MAELRDMLLCEHCVAAIKSRGEQMMVNPEYIDMLEAEENDLKCEWCDDVTDLYEVIFL